MESSILASQKLHNDNSDYGKASRYLKQNSFKNLLRIPKAVNSASRITPVESLLDYGTGQGGLLESLAVENTSLSTADGYDPAVERFSEKPSRSYDVVTCIDVLEHLDKDSIGAALKQIKQFTKKFFFYCIDLVPSSKSLSDGRNAHTLLAPPDWWCQKIKNEFLIATFIEVGHLPDGSSYPQHLFGCATNSMNYFSAMNAFIESVKIANVKHTWGAHKQLLVSNYKD